MARGVSVATGAPKFSSRILVISVSVTPPKTERGFWGLRLRWKKPRRTDALVKYTSMINK